MGRSNPESPDYVRKYGSPTILVDGEDVAGEAPGDGAASCRMYMDNNGRRDVVPSVDVIVSALLRENEKATSGVKIGKSEGSIGGGVYILPAIGVALLPKLTCAACWPACAWLLGVLGIGFVNYTPYLAPLLAFFLTLAVAPLAFQVRKRRGYGPFALGLTAAVAVIADRLWLGSDMAMYGGLGLLVAASIWNTWPKRVSENAPCPACPGRRGLMNSP